MSRKGVTLVELLAAIVIMGLVVSLAASVISLISDASNRIEMNAQANSQGLLIDREIKDALQQFGPTDYAICGTDCVTFNKEFIYEFDPVLEDIVLTIYDPALTHSVQISNGEILVNSVPLMINHFSIGDGSNIEIVENQSQAYFIMTLELVGSNGEIFTFTTSYSFAILAIPAP